ncbi:class GN sortase [Thalassotalea profundi]|uniref:Class GN sortase n=1 Tax=Thalassotalea profundi TaxID=2036687 RepID=A0ABQ3INT6_9GAMM|nr:class GN sortase [Thalassotalea profundi]GHE85667.1 class GN sortase [Thalassotalea profundi]
MKLIFIYILFVIGGLLCIHASWLPAKAWLSQQLISYSWHQSIDQQKLYRKKVAIKPWPWADTFPIAELSFKRIEKDIVVLNGGDPTTLAFSAGAIAPFNLANHTSAFVVAGHNDSHFSFLEDVIMKDVISMTDQYGKSQLYQVEAIDIIDASSGQLPIVTNNSSLILITCYPFSSVGNNTNERYVITAKLI